MGNNLKSTDMREYRHAAKINRRDRINKQAADSFRGERNEPYHIFFVSVTIVQAIENKI